MMFIILIMSTMMTISSTNLFMTWMCLELNLFSFIPIMMNKMKSNNTEAMINYFLPQALGSSLFLMNSTMLMSMQHLQKLNSLLLLMAITLKLGIAPCHHWYPLTMEKIDWPNCLILSTWQKIAPLFILLFILAPSIILYFLSATITINAILGSMMGLSQTSLKKIMAYSSMVHMSWLLSGLLTNTKCLSIAYFLLYITTVTPLFLMLNNMNYINIHDIWNKQNTHTTNKITLSLLLLSMAGLPPLTGFMPKLLMMNILMKYSMMTTITLIIASTMSLFFYLNISLNSTMKWQEALILNKYYPMCHNQMMMISATSLLTLMITFL